jgi:hypothetical protein
MLNHICGAWHRQQAEKTTPQASKKLILPIVLAATAA